MRNNRFLIHGFRPNCLVQGTDGALYGTTNFGGSDNIGTVFEIAPDGSGYTMLHQFTGYPYDDGGAYPIGVIQGADRALYGTALGGSSSGVGVIFRIPPDGGTGYVVHTFAGDATVPRGTLIQGPDGTLYGTTTQGSTIFQIAPDGSGFTILHKFAGGATDGQTPVGALLQGPDGTLYGMTRDGGESNLGTIFQIAPDGSGFSILHSFSAADGAAGDPGGLIQASDATLYGWKRSNNSDDIGYVFRLTSDAPGLRHLRRRPC